MFPFFYVLLECLFIILVCPLSKFDLSEREPPVQELALEAHVYGKVIRVLRLHFLLLLWLEHLLSA